MSGPVAWPSALGARALDTAEAYQALECFATEYGREPLQLLLHAAVPETLRADLLHLIRLNFMPGRDDPSLEADLLFAPLTRALGGGYFRIEPQVRWHALILLRSLYRDEARPRAQRVAELVWRHLERLGRSARPGSDAVLAEYIEVQRWVALAHLDPRGTARAFAQALQVQDTLAPAARLRLGGLAAAIELPLTGEQELLAYARGLDALAAGQDAQAQRWLGALGDSALQVGDVTLRPASQWLAEAAQPAQAHAWAEPAEPAEATTTSQAEPVPSPKDDVSAGPTLLLVLPGDLAEDPEQVPWLQRFQRTVPEAAALEAFSLRLADRDWSALLPALLRAERVLLWLPPGDPQAHLLLGIAWGLRPRGVLAVGPNLTAPDGVPNGYRFDGGSGSNLAMAEGLAEALRQALNEDPTTPLYAALPELLPPSVAVTGGPPGPRPGDGDGPPRDGVMLGFDPSERSDASGGLSYAVRETLMRMQVEPWRLDLGDPRELIHGELLQRLANTGMAVVDLTGPRPRDLVLAGLRLVLDPWRTVLMTSQPDRAGWLPSGMRAFAPPRGAFSLGKALNDWMNARLKSADTNIVYELLPGLLPPRRPQGAAQAATNTRQHDPGPLTDLFIVRTQPNELDYSFDGHGGLARETVKVDPAVMRRLMRELNSAHNTVNAEALAALRELVLPADLRDRLARASASLQRLTLDLSAATLPWELLLAPPPDPSFEGVRLPAMLRVWGDRRPPDRPASGALLVGPPRLGPEMTDLPGARSEIEQAARLLDEAGFQVQTSLDEDARQVIHRLLSQDWQVLHLAGHETEDAPRHDEALGDARSVGLMLSDHAVLGLREIRAMRQVPEVLLLNVQRMGRIGSTSTGQLNREHVLQLFDEGCRCIVALTGLVDDQLAVVFATTLLKRLLQGQPIEPALAAARTAAWRARPEPGNTAWAAYQVWAPAGYQLIPATEAPEDKRMPKNKKRKA